MKKPNFFIVGAPKSGTTSMVVYLKEHPEIFMPMWKEPHYFGTDLVSATFTRDTDTYLELFSNADEYTRVGEKSTWYLFSEQAATEIKRFSPDAKIIIMLRNPVDMIYSLHSHNVYRGNEDIVDFGAALDAQSDRERGKQIPKGTPFPECLFYTQVGHCTKQINRYFSLFGRRHVLVIIFDDLENNPGKIYQETVKFLGVDGSFQPEFGVANANKRIRSKMVQAVYRSPSPLFRWIVKTVLPLSLRQHLLEFIVQFNTIRTPRQGMDANLRTRLQAEFRSEVNQLCDLLQRDLSHWINPQD